MKIIILLALLLVAPGAIAQQIGCGDDGRPPCEEEGQAQENTNVVENANVSEIVSEISNSPSINVNVGGDSVEYEGGDSRSEASATGGTTQATAGSRININEAVNYPASQAAPLHLGFCQSGLSAQWEDVGLSSAHATQFCRYLQIAEAAFKRYTRELQISGCGSIEIGQEVDGEDFIFDNRTVCRSSPESDSALASYRLNVQLAEELVISSRHTGQLNQWFGDLFRPLLTVGGLVLLLLL